MKEFIKKVIYKVSVKPFEYYTVELSKMKVISFDVFNTLIRRDVAYPEDVFEIVEKKIPKEFNIEHFKALRLQAEKAVRQEHSGREISLEEIYDYLPWSTEIKANLMKLECEEEVSISVQNVAVKRIYDECIKKHKRVLFISDMYLPNETVKRILNKCGYNEGILYVSSESGKMKRTGELFKFVGQKESISTTDWVHIGDSIISDYLQPRRLGIKSLLIDQNPNFFPYTDKKLLKKDLSYRQLNTFINNRILHFTDPYEIIGYGVLGPLLYGFSRWLEEKIPSDRQIVFLAREGALLQKAFSIISDRPSLYLHISRHAAYEAFLDRADNSEQALQSRIRVLKAICSKEEFARSCGLTDEEIDVFFRENHLRKEELCPRLADKKAVLDVIWPSVKEHAAGQYKLMSQYLKQLGIKENCSVIDVGWRGTIQTILSSLEFNLNGNPIKWDGYYMGCREYRANDATSVYQCSNRQGYLFDIAKNKRNKNTIENSVSFFELLFLSTDGTTKSYIMETKNHVTPVLGPPDNNLTINNLIERIQNAGIQFLIDISDLRFPISMEAAFANYEVIARVPTLKTLRLFKNFTAYDEHIYSLANDHSLGYYLIHPKQFIKEFAKKPNRSWFLKGIFKVPLPYVTFLNFLRFLFDEK